MRIPKISGRDKLFNIIRKRREVEVIEDEYTVDEAYLYHDLVYILSRDGKYYYKIRYDDYIYLVNNGKIRKKKIILII